MPTPYAKVLVSVNGGANQSGGLEVPSGATLTFTPESIEGWEQAKWEFTDYPEGWATPAGWTLAADGTIFYAGYTPPPVTLPASTALWGVWMFRLRVNEQVTDDKNVLPDLLDTTTCFSMLSPSGLRGIGAREGDQFTTASTRLKRWLRSFQRDLVVLENLLGAAGVALATPHGSAPQDPAEIESLADGATQTIGTTFALLNDTTHVVDVQVIVSTVGNAATKVFNERRVFRVAGSTVNALAKDIMAGPKADPDPGPINVTITITNTLSTGRVEITNNSGQAVRVRCVRQVDYMTAPAAAAVPAAPTAIAPTSGPAAGGTAVTITVPDSTGLTGAKVGGVALTGFAIVDATHVSGTTGAHAAGAVDVVVTNASGDSPALAAAFTYSAAFARESLALQVFLSSAFTNYSRVAGPPAVGTFAGVASAGASGGRNFVDTDDGFTEPPGTSAPLNGRVGAAFAPATLPDRLNSNPVVASDVYSASTYSGWMLINATSSATDNPDAYDNDSVIASYTTSWFGLVLKSSGKVVVYHYDGTDFAGAEAPFTFGTPQYVHWKFTGGSLKIGVNGTWGTPVAKGNVANLTEMIKLGRNPADARSLTATLHELAMTNIALSDADLATNVKGDINTDFGLAL